jgi:putative ABC transport system permease protein
VRLLRGRDVTDADRMSSPGVVIVNEAFARRHFAGADPVGHVVRRGGAWWPGQPTDFEIVGVVADEPFPGPNAPAEGALYYAHAQFPMQDLWLSVRTDGSPATLATLDRAVRRAIWAIDPDLPVEPLRAMPELVAQTSAEPRFNTLLLTLFAAVALILAAVGIYGVLSYTVAQRAGEIGVRMALGADRGNVQLMVLRQVGIMLLVGGAIGIAGALALGRAAGSLLYGVDGRDPVIFAGAAILLSLFALAAGYIPALRASRVDPLHALRYE